MNRLSLRAAESGISSDRGHLLRSVVWLLFALLALRFATVWTSAATGLALPGIGKVGFTALFTAFSVLHAATLLGWLRALLFVAICVMVTWSFEQAGIVTGAVYGAYHYSDLLGPKLGAVPILIPFAWFMMIYASWIVAQVLLQGTGAPATLRATTPRILVAAMTMTAWDTVMDPGMARSGVWTWEQGGAYFGVPLQNFGGWMLTTLTVYALAELALRAVRSAPSEAPGGVYPALPVFVYGFVALERVLLPDLPELRVVAAVGMGFIAVLSILRVISAETPAWPR